MKAPLYNKVHQLSLDIVNASEDLKLEWEKYNNLKLFCEKNEKSKNNHPLQWEALADFTTDNNQSLLIYKKALELANELSLNDYSVSIYFAMAERHFSSGNVEQAFNLAYQANELAKSINNLELKQEISEFLLTISKTPNK